MRLNSLEITRQIEEEFSSFIASEYKVDELEIQQQIQRELMNVEIFNGPLVKAELPFEKGETIRQLVSNGELHPDMLKIFSKYPDRPMYIHQVEALRKASRGRSLVITTGTGSGKTESFLYPVINSILHAKEMDRKPGVKALILYPMNALVNDQMDRIRDYLRNYPMITFGRFIGETEEKVSPEKRRELNAPSNELVSREEMRETPPDILVTNYSMLEYLLIRPNDSRIINPQTMHAWQFMILDEAHTYSGTKGTEISYLLRRLEGFTQRKPQYLLTSATLGNQDTIDEITSFGCRLTSSEYSADDVVFATRQTRDQDVATFTPSPERYTEIRKALDEKQSLADLLDPVGYNSQLSDEENLYNFLFKDRNTYRLLELVRNTIPFSHLLKQMEGFSDEKWNELVDLIDLVRRAKKEDGSYLYDIKYHVFITSPNRAFITLGKSRKLKFGNYTEIDGEKAFEIGRCRNCDHLYLIGKIDKNGILQPEDSVDVYENYEDSDWRDLEIFSLTDENEGNAVWEEYLLCPHCGKIHEKTHDSADWCKCPSEDCIPVYKIVRKEEQKLKKNNLMVCPHCGQMNKSSGMLHSFRLDMDTATSIISLIYLNALSEDKETAKADKPDEFSENLFDLFSDDLPDEAEETIKAKKVPQLLVFSDGRQRASYFAVRLQKTHDKFLRCNLINETVKENGPISLKSLAAKVTDKIEKRELFTNNSQTEAWMGILSDLLFLEGNSSPESLGLYAYLFDPNSNLDFNKRLDVNSRSIQDIFGLTVEEFVQLINFAVRWMRKKLVIDYSVSELSQNEQSNLFEYDQKSRSLCLRKARAQSAASKYQISFIPVNNNGENDLTSYLKKICPGKDTGQLLEQLFKVLKNLKVITKSKETDSDSFQVKAENFRVHPASSIQWYQCEKCKRITNVNIHDKCPERDCNGSLVPYNPEAEENQDNYYKKNYQFIKQEKMVAQEHTAQIEHAKAREYQNDFKNKKINVLSCSTTFEVGVDIGDLENVFLRNVPPTPANYIQRAGRAGRGKDSSALVITYCLNKSHDYAYFQNPQDMINGIVRPPIFTTTNEKIVLRHLVATALGFYYRHHNEDYKKVEFILEGQMKPFIDYLHSKPQDLNHFVDHWLLREDDLASYRNFGWVKVIEAPGSKDEAPGILKRFLVEIHEQFKDYVEGIETAKEDNDFELARELSAGIVALKSKGTIELLSSGAVIPKYGFPADVVNLKTWSKNVNLNRNLQIALSEYAPDSEVVADGKKYISRYINIPANAGIETKYYAECPQCNSIETQVIPFEGHETCGNCGHELVSAEKKYIIPSYGFMAEWDPKAANQKPKKTYAGQIRALVDRKEPDDRKSYCNGDVEVELIKGRTLAMLNDSSFYYCKKCGYTRRNSRLIVSTMKWKHKNYWGKDCPESKLERITLGYTFKTDAVRVKISILTADQTESNRYAQLLTTAYALLEGLSRVLQIDRNDIDALVIRKTSKDYELLLFDSAAGGAGYVQSLMNEESFVKVIQAAYEVVNQNCCDESTTCNRCLRNYYNQANHPIMKRKYARDLLKEILNSIDQTAAAPEGDKS